MKKISIIVPVYNSEKYLAACVDSILAQTYTSFECILVDDCSTDRSPAICDAYSCADKRVQVIHNPVNQGSSLSRKTGLDAACGEYVQFIDSDDWIEENMLEKLVTTAIDDNFDVLWQDHFGYDDIYCKQIINNDDKPGILKRIFDDENGATASIWTKFIKKDLLSGIYFPQAMMWEDLVLTTQIIFKSKNIGHLAQAFYHHRRNQDSLSGNGKSEKKLEEIISNLSTAIDYCREYFGNSLSLLEPELSACVNWFKLDSRFYPSFRKSNMLFDLYPESNSKIFHRSFKQPFRKKIILFACIKKIPGIYMAFDLLRFIVKQSK